MDQKFFLYARKSTDVEDKQILSIEAQLSELRSYARQEELDIIEEFIEKQSAKLPGRPIFNSMIARIEKGEAQGIISWHPDRLARNSVDGGRIIYLLDTNKLQKLKFPSFWFESTPQGKFMLNMAFVQSKYYVDALSENTKRGLRQKVRRGEYPGIAPVGYLNDVRTKSIIVDKKKSVVIRKAFELYAQNNSRLEDIATFLAKHGITTSHGKPLFRNRITYLLSNPFYYGHFIYSGELYEGKHTPLISKQLFDRVQEVLRDRGRTHHNPKNEPQALCGLIHCGSCHMMITAEHRIKKQNNGAVHHYTYYRCTKKSKTIPCNEPHIREEELDRQLSALLGQFTLPKTWAEQLLIMIEKDRTESNQASTHFIQGTKNTIAEIQTKLQRLLGSYLEQDIEREVYLKKKAEFMSEKKSLEEKSIKLNHEQTSWVEPMRKWIETARNVEKIARDTNLTAKKVLAKEIFGSNLTLTNKTVTRGELKNGQNWPQKPWGELYVARENVDKTPDCLLVVPKEGIEPSWIAPHDFESCASTNSATSAYFVRILS